MIHHKNPQKHKSVARLIALHSGLNPNGENVQHHVDKKEIANVKFIVKLSKLTGEFYFKSFEQISLNRGQFQSCERGR